jgi:hypothetical protein
MNGAIVKVFTVARENDKVSWQENTMGDSIFCYRDGRVYLGWLEDWQPYATRTAQSSFARTTETWSEWSYVKTPSYTLNWRDLPADELAQAEVLNNNNEEVWQALDDIWHRRPEILYNVAGLQPFE